MTDGLSTLYQDLLGGSYDCVDRIVLNAYFRMGHGPGGFRAWWRALTGSDETLENAHLMRMARSFSRRIMPRLTTSRLSTAWPGRASTTLRKSIWPRPRSPRDCFWSWSV